MPLLQSPSPVAPSRRARTPWRVALTGAAASALLLALGVVGETKPGAAVAAADRKSTRLNSSHAR